MAIVAVLPLIAMVCLLSCRTAWAFMLSRAGVEIRFFLMGVPGYLEARFREAPRETQQRLSKFSLWNRRFLWLVLASLASAFFVAIPFLLAQVGGGFGEQFEETVEPNVSPLVEQVKSWW